MTVRHVAGSQTKLITRILFWGVVVATFVGWIVYASSLETSRYVIDREILPFSNPPKLVYIVRGRFPDSATTYRICDTKAEAEEYVRKANEAWK